MNYEDFKYVEVAIGSINKRGRVMKISEAIAEIKKDSTKPAFVSVHRFDKSFHDYLTERETVRGYTGPSYAPFVPFDFDDAELELSHTRAQQFLGEMINGFNAPADQINVFFSGRKGYHIYLPAQFFGNWAPSDTLYKKLRTLALRLGEAHNIDPAIYDQKRLLRHPMTKHDATDLYKRRIPTKEFLAATVKDVQEMAVTAGDNDIVPFNRCQEVPELGAIWLDCQKTPAKAASQVPVEHQTLKGSFPTDLKEGDGRDNHVYWKARQFRNWGVPAYETYNVLQMWDNTMETPLTTTNGPNILWDKIKSAYGNDADLDADQGVQVFNGRESLHQYQAYLDNPGAKIQTGYEEIDQRHRHIRSGEVVILLGKTGSGKTAFALNMLRNMAMANHKVLFFSLEMTLARVVERQCAIEAGVSANEIEANFTGNRDLMNLPWWDNSYLCAQPNMSMAQIEEAIQRQSDYTGAVEVACIDYMGLIRATSAGNSSVSSYQAVSEIAASLKAVSKRCNCAIIVLSQISRNHGDEGDSHFGLSSGRDSGVIEEGADLVLGIHRPELHGKDRVMRVQILKSRKGSIHPPATSFIYGWHGPSFRVQPGQINEMDLSSDRESFIREPAPPVTAKEAEKIQTIQETFDAEIIA